MNSNPSDDFMSLPLEVGSLLDPIISHFCFRFDFVMRAVKMDLCEIVFLCVCAIQWGLLWCGAENCKILGVGGLEFVHLSFFWEIPLCCVWMGQFIVSENFK